MIQKFTFNNHYILNELPLEEKKRLEHVMRSKKLNKNQSIFTQDSIPSSVFLVKEGKIKKFKVDTEGREQIIYIYNPGEFFGYSAILSGEPYSTSTVAIEDTTISFIRKNDFLQVLDQSPTLSRLLLKSLSHEFQVTINLMAVLSQRTVRERIALCLLILNSKYSISQPQDITISRQDMANMAGTVIETLARVLHEFKDENLISFHGKHIKVENPGDLQKIVSFY